MCGSLATPVRAIADFQIHFSLRLVVSPTSLHCVGSLSLWRQFELSQLLLLLLLPGGTHATAQAESILGSSWRAIPKEISGATQTTYASEASSHR